MHQNAVVIEKDDSLHFASVTSLCEIGDRVQLKTVRAKRLFSLFLHAYYTDRPRVISLRNRGHNFPAARIGDFIVE